MCFRDNHTSSTDCDILKCRGIRGELDTTGTSLKPSDLGCCSLRGKPLSKCFVPSRADKKKNLFLLTFFKKSKVKFAVDDICMQGLALGFFTWYLRVYF